MSMDRMLKKRWLSWRRVLGGLTVLAAVGAAGWMLLGTGREQVLRVDPDRISVATVTAGAFQEFVPVQGTIQPRQTIFLDTVEGGQVVEVYREPGSMVKAGDPLLKLANTDLQLQILSREAELSQQSNTLRTTRLDLQRFELQQRRDMADLELDLTQTRREHERNQRLLAENLISRQDFDKTQDRFQYLQRRKELLEATASQERQMRREQIQQLEEALSRLQETLHLVRNKLDVLTVRAPVSGLLSSLDAQKGQNRTSGQRLGQVDLLDGFKVRAAIDETYIKRIQVGRRAICETDGQKTTLTVTKVYPEVHDGSFEVDLAFDGPPPAGSRRGQTLQMRLDLSERRAATLLPTGGFFQQTGGNWIYRLEEGGASAVRVPIRLGMANTDHFEVLEGLHPGDRVVVSSYETFGAAARLILK